MKNAFSPDRLFPAVKDICADLAKIEEGLVSGTTSVGFVRLPDYRIAEVLVVVTTMEEDFIQDPNADQA